MYTACTRVPSTPHEPVSDLEANLNKYADWLAQAELESSLVKGFREAWPQRFVELCTFHLSVLIDVPSGFFEETVTSEAESLQRTPPRLVAPEMVGGDTGGTTGESTHRLPSKRPIKPWQRFRHIPPNDTETGRSFHVNRRRNVHNSSGTRSGIADQVFRNIMLVMDALDTPDHLSVEGIFRKTGNVVRQRIVRQRILSDRLLNPEALLHFSEPKPWRPAGRIPIPTPSAVSRRGQFTLVSESTCTSSQINVHDLASGLKGVLYELPEPILSSRLLPLFAQVAALTAGRIDDRGTRVQLRPVEERIAEAKQLKALRLLCLLLPDAHTRIFQRLLQLLQRTLDYSDQNRMTAESLGTLFGPLLLSPGKVHIRDLHIQYNNLARLATTMIQQGVSGLWMIPRSFAQDIERNHAHLQYALGITLNGPLQTCDNHVPTEVQFSVPASDNLIRTASEDSGLGWNETSQPNGGSDADSSVMPYKSADLPAMVTCINFAVRSKLEPTNCLDSHSLDDESTTIGTSHHSSLGETEYAVAELCAAVQAMPDTDPRKRRLIQRFNATNGGLTPGSNELGRHAFNGRQQWSRNKTSRTPSPSPTSAPFVRANTGHSAFKAAKTIRSSLRRRLALKSTISISSCFEHQVYNKPIFERNEQTPVNEKSTTISACVDDRQSFASPIFDCPPLQIKDFDSPNSLSLSTLGFDRATTTTTTTTPQPTNASARISLISTTSVASLGVNGGAGSTSDLFFCCPLVEALASPFRRRVPGIGPHQTPDSVRSQTTSTTPLSRANRTGRKRLRCMSPPIVVSDSSVLCDVSTRNDYGTSRLCTPSALTQSYFPIAFSGMLRQPDVSKRFRETTCNLNNEKQINTNTLVKLPGLWRMTTQTNLLAYGYRTVAQARRFRSSSAHSMRIQRSETMPCVKSIASNVATGRACALPIRPCESLEILASRSIEHDSRGT